MYSCALVSLHLLSPFGVVGLQLALAAAVLPVIAVYVAERVNRLRYEREPWSRNLASEEAAGPSNSASTRSKKGF